MAVLCEVGSVWFETPRIWPYLPCYGSATISFLVIAVFLFPSLLWQCFQFLVMTVLLCSFLVMTVPPFPSLLWQCFHFIVMTVLLFPSLLWQCFVSFYIPMVPLQNHHNIPLRVWTSRLINYPFSSPIPFPIMNLITHLILTQNLRHKWL